MSLAGSWQSLYQQHHSYNIWMHLIENGSTGPISTQNLAQPQACNAAGDCKAMRWEEALLADVEGDRGAICSLLLSPQLCLPPGLCGDPAAHTGVAGQDLAQLGHLTELCLQHADRVGSLGHVHLVCCLLVQEAAEDLLEALAEVFGDQGVDDGVDTGVGVGDDVREDAEHVRGVVEGEVPEPHAEDDQVMGQPAEAEQDGNDDDHPGDLPLGLLGL